jgi:hypothetical protein
MNIGGKKQPDSMSMELVTAHPRRATGHLPRRDFYLASRPPLPYSHRFRWGIV